MIESNDIRRRGLRAHEREFCIRDPARIVQKREQRMAFVDSAGNEFHR